MRRKALRPVRRCALAGVLLVGALLTTSCADSRRQQVYAVRGKILYQGRPAAGATVIFHPKNTSDPQAVCPMGKVGADGSFTLSTYAPEDGAPPGEYAVVVIWPQAGGGKKGGDRLKGRYGNTRNSPLHARLAERDNDLPPFGLR
jgi:hypothetical protein